MSDPKSAERRQFPIAENRLLLLDPEKGEQWFKRLTTKTGALDPDKLTSENLEQLRADLTQVVRERFADLLGQWLDFEQENPENEVARDLGSFLTY